MSNTQSFKGYRRAESELEQASKRLEEKRRSLEEKTRTFEEKARMEKLAIDRKLLVEILQEENRTHDAATRELEEKIANLDQQLKPESTTRSIPIEMPSEPVQETQEPVQETSEPFQEPVQETTDDIDALQIRARKLLQEPEQSEPEAPPEAPKKKKRGLF